MRFPAIKNVARALRNINEIVADECDVRLQVVPEDGIHGRAGWIVRWGDAQYDLDHRGFWGASYVPGGSRRFDSYAIARELIEQARDHAAQEG